MKRSMLIRVAFTVLCSGSTWADVNETARSISVSGTVEAQTVPDQVVWHITLSETDRDLRAAKHRNDQAAERVQALRDKLDIEPQDFQTGNLSVTREYERGTHGQRGKFKHFLLTRTIVIRQKDLPRFDIFLDALVSSADMEVSYHYHSTRLHELRAETRLKALKVAQDKAADMAEVVGAELGRVLTVSEEQTRPYMPRRANVSFASNMAFTDEVPAADVGRDNFVPTDITVRMTVHASFELK